MFSQNDNINILVIRFKRIGDAILSLPLCHSLKLTFPNSKVDFVLYEEASPLFEGHPYIDNVITITKKEQKNPLKYLLLMLIFSFTFIAINKTLVLKKYENEAQKHFDIADKYYKEEDYSNSVKEINMALDI